MNVLWGLADAVRFLTAVPVALSEEESAEGARWAGLLFPVVGLMIGLLLAGVMSLPMPPLPAAAVTVAVWAALTGGTSRDGATLVLRFGALAVLSPAAVVLAPVVGGWSAAVSQTLAQPDGEPGSGVLGPRERSVLFTTAITLFLILVIAAWTVQPTMLLAWPLSALATGAWAWWKAQGVGRRSADDSRTLGVVADTATLYSVILMAPF